MPGAGEGVELPWWTYGARGMQLWFPSALGEPLTPGYQPATQADPELEFDHEVYPVGVSLSEVSVIGAPRSRWRVGRRGWDVCILWAFGF